jgi:hypothetical protein
VNQAAPDPDARSLGLVASMKRVVRDALGIDSQSFVTPLADVLWLGSPTHGYPVPAGLLTRDSVCYCVGAGDDITFDTELARLFDCRVVVIDPTPEGREHFELVRDKVARGEALHVDKGGVFHYRINRGQFERLSFLPIGVFDFRGAMRFYEPTRKNYVSHSAVMFQESGRFIELPVDRLAGIMAQQEHPGIDLLKLEIEGSEYRVIESLLADKLDIKAILVEYDEMYHAKGRAHLFRIRNSTRKLLEGGYRLVYSTPMFKRLFVRRDVFSRLSHRAI